MRRGFDVSNWTGAPDARWDALLGDEPGVLFVQTIDPPAGYPPGCTRDQVQWGLNHGWDVVAYVWKWFSTGIDDIQRRVDLLEPFTGLLVALALDVEDTTVSPLSGAVDATALPQPHLERLKRQPPPPRPASIGQVAALPLQARIDQLNAAYQVLDEFPTTGGLPGGFYGAPWYHGPYLGNTDAFASRWLWVAQYDGVYDVAAVRLFGGWTADRVLAKQPEGTISVGALGNIDPDVVADGALVARAPTPPTPPVPPSDDPAWLAKKPLVIQLAGELQSVADQLEAAAEQPDQVRQLAQGVRDRAAQILA